MNHDFRITVGFPTHPKRLLLQSRLGKVAVLALIDLWEHCATQQWNGMLMKYTPFHVSGPDSKHLTFADCGLKNLVTKEPNRIGRFLMILADNPGGT